MAAVPYTGCSSMSSARSSFTSAACRDAISDSTSVWKIRSTSGSTIAHRINATSRSRMVPVTHLRTPVTSSSEITM